MNNTYNIYITINLDSEFEVETQEDKCRTYTFSEELYPFSEVEIGDKVYALPWIVTGNFEVRYSFSGGTRCMLIKKTASNKFKFLEYSGSNKDYYDRFPYKRFLEYEI